MAVPRSAAYCGGTLTTVPLGGAEMKLGWESAEAWGFTTGLGLGSSSWDPLWPQSVYTIG